MRVVLWTSLFAFLIDQISKYVVVHMWDLERIRQIDVFPPLLRFIYAENHGINFGIGGAAGNQWIWIALAVVVCGWLLWWIRRANAPVLARVSAGLVLGGALGNVIDRVIYGYVLDFLNMSCCGFSNPYSFNIADIFIFAGAIGLVFLVPDDKKPSGKRDDKKAT